jgi:hypothetical protein
MNIASPAQGGANDVCQEAQAMDKLKGKQMGHREELIERSIPFLREVKDMTPGVAMEKWLNEKYGESSDLYKDLARLIKLGVEREWAANQDVDGPNYRRSRIL